ncbi:bifunctional riboflavin kinase/FAD synthetase [Marinoscillum sp. MHG1-6]|uniref:bifunctional riboflavin kinase/FAD synthetase n=1 Tax=Marinoscillum sp. MHG1-6 TaxID=2959627 RepID=UPI0021576E49|nr:bifunctional riboflavin kinase/FAD synthetase [Marinoscillum sp. MHG1-6]
MQIVEDLTDFRFSADTVVTSGTFDGVHIGHKKILSNLVETGKKEGLKSVVVTFWPHPRFVLKKNDTGLKLLTTFEEKARYIGEMGIDYLVKIPFTKEFSELSSEEFIQQIIVDKINTKKLVIGYDHRFGKNREGGFDYLSANSHDYGFTVSEIPRQDIEHVVVSSTQIRQALSQGDIQTANEFLDRRYALSGFVKEGDRIGRSIGFPTANLDVPESYKLIPGDGAYAVSVEVYGHQYHGMLNIGMRPTVSGEERRIEVNIFDFNKDIYNERLTIHFHELLRAERKFESIDALKEQLALDKLKALKILNNE